MHTQPGSNAWAPPLGGAGSIASLDPSHVQQTKSEIRKLAAEIAELAHSKIESAAFWEGFLPRVTVAMGATGAAVWHVRPSTSAPSVDRNKTTPEHLDTSNREDHSASERQTADEVTQASAFSLIAHHQLPSALQTVVSSEPRSDRVTSREPANSGSGDPTNSGSGDMMPTTEHARILYAVASEGQPILVPPSTVQLDAQRPTNPLEESLIIVPVRREDHVEYLLEVVLGASGGPAAQRGYLRFVAQMADLMADFLRRHRLRELEEKTERQTSQQQWLLRLAAERESQRRFAVAANGINDCLSCQQTVIVKSSGRRVAVVAVSGATQIDPHSEIVENIQRLHRMTIQQFDPQDRNSTSLLLTSSSATRPNDLNEQATNRVGNDPIDLHRVESLGDAHEPVTHKQNPALQDLIDATCDRLRTNSVTRHRLSPPVMSTAETSRCDELFVYCFATSPAAFDTSVTQPILSAFTGLLATQPQSSSWLSAFKWTRALGNGRSIAVRIVTVVSLIACAVIPVPQRIAVTGILHPVARKHYYAPEKSTVQALFVEEGDVVKKGDTLLQLSSDVLGEEMDVLDGELSKTRSWRDSLNSNSGTGFEYTQAQIEIKKLETLRQAQKNRLDRLTIKAQEDGRIATWDLASSLLHRQVESDTLLLSTFDPNGQWYIDLSIPDNRIGLVDQTLSDQQCASVSFTLMSEPDQSYAASLTEVSSQSFDDPSRSSQTRVVHGRATITSPDLRLRRDGVPIRATVECGTVPAIWLLVRDAYWEVSSRLSLLW